MRLSLSALGFSYLLLTLTAPVAGAAPLSVKEQMAVFDKKIDAELRAIDPKLAATFAEANAARDGGHLLTAIEKFDVVRRAVPQSSHAARRQCGVEAILGQHDLAITHCRQALKTQNSAENLTALSVALIATVPGQIQTAADRREAEEKAEAATRAGPNDFYAFAALAKASLATNNFAEFRRSAARLRELGPDEIATHVISAIDATNDGEWDRAAAEVNQARAHGMPEEEAKRLEASILASRPFYLRALKPVAIVAASWLGFLGLLGVAGWLLSNATLRTITRLPSTPTGHAQGSDARLRRVYRVLLWISCGYYYASLPLLLAAMVTLACGTLVALVTAGQFPLNLLLMGVMIPAITIWGLVKSLFIPVAKTDPGARVDLQAHPALRDLLDEVAGKIPTRPVDNVYLTPGTEVAVIERGGASPRVRAQRTERCLILGAGVLEGMRMKELRAILAHEYGHFQNEDTAGGGLALAVRRSILNTVVHLAKNGAATWYNPAWWFIRGFFNLFLRISQGASRLQEVLADRWAAFTYGSEAFEQGLRHVVEREIRFGAVAGTAINEVASSRAPLVNLYSYKPSKPPLEEHLEEAIEKALTAKPSPYASHPSPAARFALVRALDARGADHAENDEADAWSVFSDRSAIEEQMTAVVRSRLPALMNR